MSEPLTPDAPTHLEGIRSDMDHLIERARRCDEKALAHYSAACPNHTNMSAFIRAFATGDLTRSYEFLRQANPLPEMCAILNPPWMFSEGASIERALGLEPTPIAEIQYTVSRLAREAGQSGLILPDAESGRQIAIVGGGPTGIAAAGALLERGHRVTIIEREHALGGTPQFLIPSRRLPDIQPEIQALLAPAVSTERLKLRLGESLGQKADLESLLNTFDAVLVAIGLWEETSLKKADLSDETQQALAGGVISGIDFLRETKAGLRTTVPAEVAVLAGDDCAMDAAVAAQMLGARNVYIVFGGPRAAMHWHRREDWFKSEGVHCLPLTQPLGYETDGHGRCVGLRVEHVLPPSAGSTSTGGRSTLPVSLVIEAMELSVAADLPDTSAANVFTAGGMLNGGATVSQCIAEGRQAAIKIERFLHAANDPPASKTQTAKRDEVRTSARPSTAITLHSCKRIAGGRCDTPENTVARLEPVIRARHDYRYIEEEVAEHLHWSALFIDDLDFRAMGKGITQMWSRAGALAESAEWLAARAVTALPGYTIAYQRDLENALPIAALLPHVASTTPELLRRIEQLDCARHWVNGCSLFSGKTVSLPIEYIRLISGPNGLASGNRLEEALVHAMTEIFERRAHITVLKNRMVTPTIDPESIANPLIQELLAFVKSHGIHVTIKDLSFGGKLPCVGAYFYDPAIPESFQFHHFFKVGAAFDRDLALTRVFTEFVQGRRRDEFIEALPAEQERVLRDDFRNLKCCPDDSDNFLSAFMFGFVPFTRADFLQQGEVVPFDTGTPSDDCLDDIERALALYAELGLDCFVIDLTDPEIGFPVMQVVVPGYSDALPYHPSDSPILYRRWTRDEVLNSYPRGW